MSLPSHIANPEQDKSLDAAAREYTSQLFALARGHYGDGFDEWAPEMQQSAALTLALQGLLRPGAFAAQQMDLNSAFYGIGLALGTQSASFTDAQARVLLEKVAQGFGVGRTESIKARDAFKTTGSMN